MTEANEWLEPERGRICNSLFDLLKEAIAGKLTVPKSPVELHTCGLRTISSVNQCCVSTSETARLGSSNQE